MCGEWYEYAICSDTPHERRPCAEENDAYGVCLGTH
jgi:hypothetical protein